MSVPYNEDRRANPRFKVWVACSVLPSLSDEGFPGQAVLGNVKDLSRDAVAVLLPSNETKGLDAFSVGKPAQLTLALPVGYVRLSATLIRSWADDSEKHLFVFRIQKSKELRKYFDYLKSLQSE